MRKERRINLSIYLSITRYSDVIAEDETAQGGDDAGEQSVGRQSSGIVLRLAGGDDMSSGHASKSEPRKKTKGIKNESASENNRRKEKTIYSRTKLLSSATWHFFFFFLFEDIFLLKCFSCLIFFISFQKVNGILDKLLNKTLLCFNFGLFFLY